MPKFHVVSYHGDAVSERRVFNELNMEESSLKDADFICFPGGEDINPELYGESRLPYTSFSLDRDDYEIDAFGKVSENQWCIGICRGAQLLAALSGGTLWQDVDNHTGAPHVTFLLNKKLETRWGNGVALVNSYHHQMVKDLPSDFEILAASNISTRKVSEIVAVSRDNLDIEVAWSKSRKIILFQAHPEFGHEPTRKFFNEVVLHCIGEA